MDKYEYQVCADQIKSLLAERNYTEAVDIADTIDWRRVKSVSMLCTVSEIYKINKRYEESRDILLLAYERYPNGRMIVYALCELAIKMDDVLQAIEYYKEFAQIAPEDTGSYILLYKIYEAQEVSLEERIEVLEEFKKQDYREKWAYELACLYHKTGQETKCVEECDELILWFGEGKYVKKAMELKMEHTKLTSEQQMKYEGRQEETQPEQIAFVQPEEQSYMDSVNQQPFMQMPESPYGMEQQQYGQPYMEHPYVNNSEQPAQIPYPAVDDIQVQPVNTGKYSTLNLQEEIARNVGEVLANGENPIQAPYYGQMESLYEPAQEPENYQSMYGQPSAEAVQQMYEPLPAEAEQQMYEQPPVEAEQQIYEQPAGAKIIPYVQPAVQAAQEPQAEKKFDSILAQEYDGQISLSLPDTDMVEKQITGQISLDDILKGWEEKRKESEKKRLAEVKRRSLEQTNDIMSQ
ncbi:MAG TPA: hypothetical protein PLU43_07250, partial [Lachnospiraceae bacterium]|nr:hypothetical protein [Lachnospiraceae bacterium]